MITRISVLGAGTMGHGIAQVLAQAGIEVTLVDVARELVDRGLSRITANLDGGVAKGKVTAAAQNAALAKVCGSTDLEGALAAADLLVEAIPEDMQKKRELFALADAKMHVAAMLASNTSSLSITEIASATKRPEHVIGLHFFNPVQVMRLVEVVRTIAASDEAVRLGVAYGERIGKVAVETRDRAGFLVNRILVPFMLDAIRAFEEGVGSIEAIDAGFKLGAGHPMGPLTLNDFVGLETLSRAAEGMYDEYRDARFATPPLLRKMIAAGWYGKKTGLGFYDWSGDEPVPNPKIDLLRTV